MISKFSKKHTPAMGEQVTKFGSSTCLSFITLDMDVIFFFLMFEDISENPIKEKHHS